RAKELEEEVLKPYREKQKHLETYAETLEAELEYEFPLREEAIQDLKDLQRILSLRDEDVQPIIESALSLKAAEKDECAPIDEFNELEEVDELDKLEIAPKLQENIENEIPLESEKGIGYGRLRSLLEQQQWKEADQETAKVMLQAAGRTEHGWLNEESIKQFPCADLRTIDQLWVKYSKGHFGFSVQKEIWLEVGGKLDYKTEIKLGDRVGWRVRGKWISYDDVTFSTSTQRGHLPFGVGWGRGQRRWFEMYISAVANVNGGSHLAKRLIDCSR
ncbi:MAG: GUN4 domain-containing protein, partial [Leptolyngbya sp. SIO4C5]|nr:GUN4 domain-containing protein [Leptolyngbya sp. SIO4C5]